MNPEDFLFVVNDVPHRMMSRALVQWLTALDVWANVQWPDTSDRNMDCQTNANVIKAMRSGATHFVFVESDMRPHINITAGFWQSDADVVGCVYPTEEEHGWDHPWHIHSGLWRTRRDVLAAIDPPWFAWQYNKYRSRTTGCICSTFCGKVREAGFTIAQAGHAEHTPRPTPPGLVRRPKPVCLSP